MIRFFQGMWRQRGLTIGGFLAVAVFAVGGAAPLQAQGDLQGELCRLLLEKYASSDEQSREQAAFQMAGMLRSQDPAFRNAAQQTLALLKNAAAGSGSPRLLEAANDWQSRTARYLQPQKPAAPVVVAPPRAPFVGAPVSPPVRKPAVPTSGGYRPREPETCFACRGSGQVHCHHCSGGYLRGTGNPYQNPPTPPARCPVCNGTTEKRCLECRGTGVIR